MHLKVKSAVLISYNPLDKDFLVFSLVYFADIGLLKSTRALFPPFKVPGRAPRQKATPNRQLQEARFRIWGIARYIIKIAKKLAIFFLAIFRSKKGSGVSPISSSVVVVSDKTRVFRIAKKGQVAKKNETADDGGGCVSAALSGP